MVTDKQVKGLLKSMLEGKKLYQAAQKADMCADTARKYIRACHLPSEIAKDHNWKTRQDPFEDLWPVLEDLLDTNPGLEAKTAFDWLQRDYPGRYQEGQLRTLQRRFRNWRAWYGKGKEVFFPQIHRPGELGESDFTDMSNLAITIEGISFNHLIYHYVLTYSNWEHGSICFSESFESLAAGLQNALWYCGGVPLRHRTDRLSAAVNNLDEKREFTQKYNALLRYYNVEGEKTNPNSGNENGDVEQRHYRFKKAVEQALMLRGSSDFKSRNDYEEFLAKLFSQLNTGRQKRFDEERCCLKNLPSRRLPDYSELKNVLVGKSSTITVRKNVYSVHSRLRDAHVTVRLYSEHIEVYFESKLVQRMERLIGSKRHAINYRHVIDWLVRKPGAFANYRYRSDFFPTSQFRIAYDLLHEQCGGRADKEYLKVLHCAAHESEELVNHTLRRLINEGNIPTASTVKALVNWMQSCDMVPVVDIQVSEVELHLYDTLLTSCEEVCV